PCLYDGHRIGHKIVVFLSKLTANTWNGTWTLCLEAPGTWSWSGKRDRFPINTKKKCTGRNHELPIFGIFYGAIGELTLRGHVWTPSLGFAHPFEFTWSRISESTALSSRADPHVCRY